MSLKISPKSTLLLCLIGISSTTAALFSSANRDFIADKALLRRSYQGWLPLGASDLKFDYYTDYHPQRVVDSYGYTFHYFSQIVSRLVSLLLGSDFRSLSSDSVNTQNVLIASLGVLGCWAVGLVSREIFQSRRSELVGIVGTFLFPLWLGHSWMNQKDVPFATGFMCATAMATLAAHCPRDEKISRSLRQDFCISTFASLVLTFGTRPGLAVLTLPLFIFGMWQVRVRCSELLSMLTTVIIGALIIVLATNPASMPNPIDWTWNGIQVGRDFIGYSGDVLFDGRFVSSKNLGLIYLVKSYVSSTPLLGLVGMVGGTVLVIRQIINGSAKTVLPLVYHSTVVAGVVLGLSRNNYNAGRQFLFIVLGWQAVSIVGIYWMVTIRKQHLQLGLQLSIILLVSLLVVDHVSIFPYQYVYRNEIARWKNSFEVSGEFDYWGIAGRELASAIPDEPGQVIYFGSGDIFGGGRYTSQEGQQFVPHGSVIVDDRIKWTSQNGKPIFDYVPWLHYWPPNLDKFFRKPLLNSMNVHSAYAVMPPHRVLLGSLYRCR